MTNDSTRKLDSDPEVAMEKLRKEWDERLKPLKAPDAGQRLRDAFDDDVELDGNVRVGPGR